LKFIDSVWDKNQHVSTMKFMVKQLIVLVIIMPGVILKAAEILPPLNAESKLTLKLEADEVAIFGYGSLMNVNELERPVDDPYTGPFIMARLKGFWRSWSAQYPNHSNFIDEEGRYFKPRTVTYLNIEPHENSKVNGVLFVCSREELELYDFRESSYDRIRINDYLEEVVVLGGAAYAYTAKPENFQPTEELEPWQTVISFWYIDIIEEALETLGENFSDEFNESTQPLPEWLVYEKGVLMPFSSPFIAK